MDLKTWMFLHRIQPSQMAKIVACCPRKLRSIMERKTRPTSDIASRIEYATRKKVTIDELMCPEKYKVEWIGDTAYGRKWERLRRAVAINEEIRTVIDENLKKNRRKKKICDGQKSDWMKEKIEREKSAGLKKEPSATV